MQNLFVYGTLLFPEILKKIVGREYNSVKAVLKDYRRFAVKDFDYPAIIEQKNGMVNGNLILNVDDVAMNVLSGFEGNEYVKREVEVLADNKKIKAVVFVWCDSTIKLSENDWDENFFRQNRIGNYI
jgi:gamma-glutamylcyclotransferase (GGCT)/AIG2-like uncharacterized protein YtfP